MAAAATAGDRIVFAAAGDLGFIHLGEIGLRPGASMFWRSLAQINQAVL